MRYDKAVDLITRELIKQLQEYKAVPLPPVDTSAIEAKIKGAETLKTKIQEGYEDGPYTLVQAIEKQNTIDDRLQERMMTRLLSILCCLTCSSG